SRRRHTRFSRDWSSDVCSSDLETHTILEAQFEAGIRAHRNSVFDLFGCDRRLRLWLCTLALILLTAGQAIAGSQVDVVIGPEAQIGRASCRGRVWITAGAGTLR